MENRGKPWAGNSAGTGANNILLLAGTRRGKKVKNKAIKKVLGSFNLIWRISFCLRMGRLVFKRLSDGQGSSASATQAHPVIGSSEKIWSLKTPVQIVAWCCPTSKSVGKRNTRKPPDMPPALCHGSDTRPSCLLCAAVMCSFFFCVHVHVTTAL